MNKLSRIRSRSKKPIKELLEHISKGGGGGLAPKKERGRKGGKSKAMSADADDADADGDDGYEGVDGKDSKQARDTSVTKDAKSLGVPKPPKKMSQRARRMYDEQLAMARKQAVSLVVFPLSRPPVSSPPAALSGPTDDSF